MKKNFTEIEIPFEVKDSELYQFTYTIPDGYSAEIKDGKVIVKKKESEDERIRKWLIDYFDKVNDEVVKEDRLKIITYLEKQKENPKSADSIKEDCTSDAKCEDRWHKVGDSLPDNPRDVLCKDEAGNYFIGRHYVW